LNFLYTVSIKHRCQISRKSVKSEPIFLSPCAQTDWRTDGHGEPNSRFLANLLRRLNLHNVLRTQQTTGKVFQSCHRLFSQRISADAFIKFCSCLQHQAQRRQLRGTQLNSCQFLSWEKRKKMNEQYRYILSGRCALRSKWCVTTDGIFYQRRNGTRFFFPQRERTTVWD